MRVSDPSRRRAHPSGLTLIEMVVAIAVFSVVVLGLNNVLRSGLNTWKAGREWSEENQKARTFFRELSRDLSNMLNYSPEMEFKGTAHQISFITSVKRPLTEQESVYELARAIYRYDKQKKEILRLIAGKELGFDTNTVKPLLTLPADKPIDFFYAHQSIYESENFQWKSEWRDENALPRLIRVRVGNLESTFFVTMGKLGEK